MELNIRWSILERKDLLTLNLQSSEKLQVERRRDLVDLLLDQLEELLMIFLNPYTILENSYILLTSLKLDHQEITLTHCIFWEKVSMISYLNSRPNLRRLNLMLYSLLGTRLSQHSLDSMELRNIVVQSYLALLHLEK